MNHDWVQFTIMSSLRLESWLTIWWFIKMSDVSCAMNHMSDQKKSHPSTGIRIFADHFRDKNIFTGFRSLLNLQFPLDFLFEFKFETGYQFYWDRKDTNSVLCLSKANDSTLICFTKLNRGHYNMLHTVYSRILIAMVLNYWYTPGVWTVLYAHWKRQSKWNKSIEFEWKLQVLMMGDFKETGFIILSSPIKIPDHLFHNNVNVNGPKKWLKNNFDLFASYKQNKVTVMRAWIYWLWN